MAWSDTFRAKYGPWAIITGAAQGLGTEFARQTAAMGLDLVLVDIQEERLSRAASEVRAQYPVEIRSAIVDLSRPDFLDPLRKHTDDIEVGLVISNAAHLPVGLFFDQSLADKLRMIEVNCRAPLMLVQEFGARMVARRKGGIILMASASATQGVPFVASYAATKAYNLILAESLWDELREHKVDVLGFMPGATRTTGFVESKPRLAGSTVAVIMEPGPTATEALKALGKAPSWIPGRRNRMTLAIANRVLPRKFLIRLVGSNMRHWYGHKSGSGQAEAPSGSGSAV